ncbi:hypothetical protein [Afipia felis]|uniref:Uncharacterized protein n=2 Tax=Afipia felis TaxID=1035 RepID=A0A380WAS5_AFIFE|nr:hypothetical protein [Afipia felis]EKS28470.1 hypothetical protein HMPREF9697_00998 [Afipia felis ATCC 53690]SUU77178.1 Uncharacterised protein [Afipia felis]SUU85245.1 Uncharacterised protein [Afipia felis]
MKLAIFKVESAGSFDRERIVVKVTENADLGDYMILMADPISPDLIAGGAIPYTFWFDAKNVKKGDLVVLYSKEGTSSEKTNPNGSTSYFFYWGLKQASWPKYRAVLAEISDYDFQEFLYDEDIPTGDFSP